MISFGRSWQLAGVAVLSSFLAACGDKEDPFDCSEDYTLEQFWTGYYEIECSYLSTCIWSDPNALEHDYCVQTYTEMRMGECYEDEFNPCGSWACIEAWRVEVEILDSEGLLDECPMGWNIPLHGVCQDSQLWNDDCGVFDE